MSQNQNTAADSSSMTLSTNNNSGDTAAAAAGTSNGLNNNNLAALSLLTSNEEPLYVRYPVLSRWEFELLPNKTKVQGIVYCTDMVSQTISLLPLQFLSASQTLDSNSNAINFNDTTEIRIVHVNGICKASPLQNDDENTTLDEEEEKKKQQTDKLLLLLLSTNNNNTSGGDKMTTTAASTSGGAASSASAVVPATIHKKTLEDRERRAIRQAEESFRHINEKVSPEGQEVFDRLLKACGEVVWQSDTNVICVVNSHIKVDPPYKVENVHYYDSTSTSGSNKNNNNGKNQAGLERVQKIVASVYNTNNSNNDQQQQKSANK